MYKPSLSSATTSGEGSDYTVYDQKIWRSDVWDALDYAQEIDREKPVLEQFDMLMKTVPHSSLNV